MLSSIARGNSGLLLEKRRGDRNQQGLVSCHAYQHETDQSLFSRLTSLIYTHCSNDLIQKSDKLYAENRGKHGNYGVCFFLEGVNALNFCRRRVRKVLGMLAAFLCLALASCATVTPSVASPEVPVEVPQSDDKPVVEEQEFPVEIVPPEIDAAEEKPVPQAEAEPLVFPGSTLLGTLPYEPESTEEEIITVSMWESGEREERLERAFDLYESLHPGVSIDAEFIDYNGYWGNIALDAGSGRLSDIIEMDRTHLRTFEQRSLIKDISEYFDGISGYGLPLGLVSDVMLYDEALVDESGTVVSNPLTMDNLVDVGERIYEEKGIKTAVSLKMDFLESLAASLSAAPVAGIRLPIQLSLNMGRDTLLFHSPDWSHMPSCPLHRKLRRIRALDSSYPGCCCRKKLGKYSALISVCRHSGIYLKSILREMRRNSFLSSLLSTSSHMVLCRRLGARRLQESFLIIHRKCVQECSMHQKLRLYSYMIPE